VTPDTDSGTTTSTTTTTTTTTPSTTTRTTTTPARPTPPTAPPKASDIVPASILTKYGLDPNKLETSSAYEGDKWDVGYYPYDGDVQYVAFGKHRDVFSNTAASADAYSYWEHYGSAGAPNGSRVGSGTISEDDFEMVTGVDITGDRPISDAMYRKLRECGAPADAEFALRDKDGKQLSMTATDRLVPTVKKDGKNVEVEVRDEGSYYYKGTDKPVSEDVVWRLKTKSGTVKGADTDKKESANDLVGAKDGVKFDFLDETGEPISFNPPGDKIVATYKDGDAWHAFVPKKNTAGKITGYEHQTLDKDGGRVTARETVTPERAKTLQTGKDVIHRIQTSSGSLQGDGKVGESYDMSWWGKCHNVAAIGASSMKLPATPVRVVTNLNTTDKLAVEWKDGANRMVLVPKKNQGGEVTGYALETRAADGRKTGSRDVALAEGNTLAKDKAATPVILTRAGKLKEAEVTTIGTDEVTAMVAHMGDGAVEYKGSVGSRFYGVPDQLKLKDGKTVNAFITGVETQAGKKVAVGSKSGTDDYRESDRSILRGTSLVSNRVNQGYRNVGWSSQDFTKLQADKTDKIKNVTVAYPDGRTETIAADKISALGWENKFDLSPTELWSMHKNVGAKGSSVIEKDPGTHVWNYTMENIATKPLKKENLPTYLRDKASQPGMMKGTTGEDGKHYFETKINGETFNYWAKFDAQGNLSDYAYLSDRVPDFFWTQHTKDPFTTSWTGESQAPGARMEDIQKVYVASIGGLKKYEVPGGFISKADLSRKPVQP